MNHYFRPTLLALVLIAGLTACAKPVPPDKRDYVGDWRATDMSLLITAEGNLKYQRRKGSATTSIEGPIQRFEGNNILVGIGPLSTTFVVSATPEERNEVWRMTVDGVELKRSDGRNLEW